MEDLFENHLTSDKAIVKHEPENNQWFLINPSYIDRVYKTIENLEKQKKSFERSYKKLVEDGKWWDNFKEQDIVIINEFDDYKNSQQNLKKRKLEKTNPEINQISKKYHTTIKSDNRIKTDFDSEPEVQKNLSTNEVQKNSSTNKTNHQEFLNKNEKHIHVSEEYLVYENDLFEDDSDISND
ncbi:18346_t:CDS:2 [Dentiscutata erythropus]|uniref:18346_t:CDS:1 n=1 Tax=Dentiscutata erythropus TaxID=1348616 RepID=A0A9N9IJF3_9GLOM|nr:18346_t:CDS:2 [Dentiscutata erythropus]